MVIDISAVLAILFDEEGVEVIEQAIEADPIRLISAATVLEAAIVVETRFGEAGGRELDLLLHKGGIEVISVTYDQIEVARRAYREFGKGRHPASLNFGDCFSYALSKTSGEPLLFKGDDFARSDVEKAY
jgi:ribonuclease VapC